MLSSHKELIETLKSDVAIAKAVADKRIYKVARGIYCDKPYAPFVEIARKRYPEAVVTMESAFFYQGLTDVIPETLHLATDRKASRITDKRISQHFVPSELLHLGEIEIQYNNSKVLTYDLERLAIEVARMRSKLPFDFYKEVIGSLRVHAHEMYPAKIDDYLQYFTYRESILDTIRNEVF